MSCSVFYNQLLENVYYNIYMPAHLRKIKVLSVTLYNRLLIRDDITLIYFNNCLISFTIGRLSKLFSCLDYRLNKRRVSLIPSKCWSINILNLPFARWCNSIIFCTWKITIFNFHYLLLDYHKNIEICVTQF